MQSSLKRTQVINRPSEEEKRRLLRRNATPVETILWTRIRNSQISGAKFRRQVSVGPFVVDFYCAAVRLAIELDGSSHEGEAAAKYDAGRQMIIETQDITFLRFANEQIYHNCDSAIEIIAATIERRRTIARKIATHHA